RTVAPDPGGGCGFASECNHDDDCALVADARQCCLCPSIPLPLSLAGQDCWVAQGEGVPAGCSTCGADPPCLCPAIGTPACVSTPSGLSRCVQILASPLPDGRCAAEQRCPAGGVGGGCPVCVAPGDAACGGPAPPPATCQSDEECSAAA